MVLAAVLVCDDAGLDSAAEYSNEVKSSAAAKKHWYLAAYENVEGKSGRSSNCRRHPAACIERGTSAKVTTSNKSDALGRASHLK